MARFIGDKFPAPCPASVKKSDKSCFRKLYARFLYDKFPGPGCLEEAGLNSLSNKNCTAKFKWLPLPAGASIENHLSSLGFCTLGFFMIRFQPACVKKIIKFC